MLLNCSQNSDTYIKITTFAPVLSTFFSIFCTYYRQNRPKSGFYRQNSLLHRYIFAIQPVFSIRESSFSAIFWISRAPRVVEKRSEKDSELKPFFDTTCQSKGTTLKQVCDKALTQIVDNKRVVHICHHKTKCPGLESNQHEPKLTSPSS